MIIKERIQRADGSIRFRSYLKQEKLGKGGFAECFTVERMEDKKLFALKIINKKNLEKPKAKQKMLSEINLHKSVKHKNICQLDRVFEDEENVYMLLELCNNGNMFELIKKRKRLTIQQTQYFIYQLIDGLCYLHNRQTIHRDIKLGNLLINSKMQLKLADFGLATKLEFTGDRKHTVCGTPNYIAPEVILSSMGLGISGHSYEVDVWSTGVIMYLMLVGRAPFETTRIEKTYQKISKADFDFPEHFRDNSAKDLLRKILVVDVSKRYTFEQILAHDFMNPKNGIPKEIPTSAMVVAPKFENKFEKYESQDVKSSARNFSINTLRSEVDLSLDQDFEGLPNTRKRQQKSKDIKGLLKTVFSTSSLSRSLQKLGNIGRSISPQAKNIQGLGNKTSSREKISLRDRSSSQAGSQIGIQARPSTSMVKLATHAFIVAFKKEIVLSYLLNTGYVGTYEPNYKLLYNKQQDIYFEADGDGDLRKVKPETVFNNQNIENRKKFMRGYVEGPLDCEPYTNTGRIVFLKRTFEVKAQNIMLFKLSNEHVQVNQQGSEKNLLVTDDELVLLTVRDGAEVGRHVEKKENYVDSKNKELISLYLKFKRINAQINGQKK